MKKKVLKAIAFIVALVLIIGLGLFANMFVGNPVSKILAQNTSKKHLKETYSNTDYYIEDVSYNFKEGLYYAEIKSKSSIDSNFNLLIDMGGKLKIDTYEYSVLNKSNTALRLMTEYETLADPVLNDTSFPYKCSIITATLEINNRESMEEKNNNIPDYSIITEDLELDKNYDIYELGKKAGHIIVYIDNEPLSYEQAATILLDIKNHLDSRGIPFYAIDLTLEEAADENNSTSDNSIIFINFPYKDIYEEGLVERIKTANNKTKAYYEKLDKEKELSLN